MRRDVAGWRVAAAAVSPREAGLARAGLLIAGIAASCTLRLVAGGAMPAASYPAAILFAAALIALAAGAGWRWSPEAGGRLSIGIGVAGAGFLVAAWATAAPQLPLHPGQHLGALLVWSPLVAAVAAAEEIVLRGALFGVLLETAAPAVAIVVTSSVFGLMHVPLYGWSALPLDLAAGALLGGIRLLTGGVTVPIVAHVLADLAGGWLG